MRSKSMYLFIAFSLGLGLTLALLWILSARLAPVTAAPAAELHVCPSGCTYASMQDAVDAAGDGDVIKVAAGTYTDVHVRARNDVTTTGVVTQVVYISKTVTIQGGYTTTNWTTSDPAANPTTLDALGEGRVFYITGDVSPTIEGLCITGGDAAGLGGSEEEDAGGGVYVIAATVAISNNQVSSNTADRGGGLYLESSDATLTNNTISANTATGGGGGVYLVESGATLSGNTIISNTAAADGGGLLLWFARRVITMNGNTFASNTANWSGGGLSLHLFGGRFSGNTIISNTAGRGGGVDVYGGHSTWVNNVVADNHTHSVGSGFYINGRSYLLHTTIARNTGGDGSGVHVDVHEHQWSVSVAMTNTILVSQSVGIRVTNGNTVTVNGVLWHNTPVTISQSPTATVSVQNQHTGDPAFVDPDAGNYHIGLASAAVDAGVEAGVTMDIDDEARPFGLGPDLGADEWATIETTVEPSSPSTITATVGGLTTTVEIPAQAVTQTTTLKYTALATTRYGSPAGFAFAGRAFDLDAYDGETFLSNFTFSRSVTITIHYAHADVVGLHEGTLALEYWSESTGAWEDAASTCTPSSIYDRHPDDNWLAVPICHLSQFALFGREQKEVYLPLVLRSYGP